MGHMFTQYFKHFFLLGAFLLGGLSVWGYFYFSRSIEQDCSKEYPLINSEIDCQNIEEKINRVEGLNRDIAKIVDEEKRQGRIIRASVFYRDLNTRRWFGINDTDRFYPASLIKLPIAIMYYKVAELEPYIFDKELQIPTDGGDNSDQHYPPIDPLLPGETYTLKEMIRHMLVYSDNAPFSILYEGGALFRNKILSDLGVYEPPAEQGQEVWNVSARSYANIFRMLYNASYVNVQSANEILSFLSQSMFKNGIVAGVPNTVKVAHKFGEAEGVTEDGSVHSRILNDCGIVYKRESPYILCLMMEGQEYSQIEQVMERISRSAYSITP